MMKSVIIIVIAIYPLALFALPDVCNMGGLAGRLLFTGLCKTIDYDNNRACDTHCKCTHNTDGGACYPIWYSSINANLITCVCNGTNPILNASFPCECDFNKGAAVALCEQSRFGSYLVDPCEDDCVCVHLATNGTCVNGTKGWNQNAIQCECQY